MKAIRALVLLLIAAVGTSCATTPDPVVCGQIGLAVGLGGGVAAGASSDSGSDAGTIIAGGAVGAVVGAVGGYFLCKAMEKDEPPPPPRKKAAPPPPPPPPPVEEKPDPCAQVIRLRGVNFGFNKAEISSEAAVILDEAAVLLGETLDQCPTRQLSVDGHTDSTGPEAYNLTLSERRADAVRSHLVSQGVDGSRLEAKGFGEANPIASNTEREGRALNRRVELRTIQ